VSPGRRHLFEHQSESRVTVKHFQKHFLHLSNGRSFPEYDARGNKLNLRRHDSYHNDTQDNDTHYGYKKRDTQQATYQK
jgi:hypothetical protein